MTRKTAAQIAAAERIIIAERAEHHRKVANARRLAAKIRKAEAAR